MIYPKKLSSKKGDLIFKILLFGSVLLGIILFVINKLTTPNIPWATLTNAGIIYVWITVYYSIKKNTNIAGHVMIQAIAISLLMLFIDYKLGFEKWSLNISIPIIIMIANVTMLILTIVSHKKFIRYAIYQLIIVLFSMIPVILIGEKIVENIVLSIIASSISVVNLILTLSLSAKDVKDAIIRKFHM